MSARTKRIHKKRPSTKTSGARAGIASLAILLASANATVLPGRIGFENENIDYLRNLKNRTSYESSTLESRESSRSALYGLGLFGIGSGIASAGFALFRGRKPRKNNYDSN